MSLRIGREGSGEVRERSALWWRDWCRGERPPGGEEGERERGRERRKLRKAWMAASHPDGWPAQT